MRSYCIESSSIRILTVCIWSKRGVLLLKKKVTICNELGLHARAAAKLMHLASRYVSEIRLSKAGAFVNAKSIMGLMMLAAAKGTELELEVSGEDEVSALEAVEKLVLERFGEKQ